MVVMGGTNFSDICLYRKYEKSSIALMVRIEIVLQESLLGQPLNQISLISELFQPKNMGGANFHYVSIWSS